MQRATRRRCSSNEQMQSPNSLLTELKLQNNCKAQNSSLVPKTGSRHLPSSVICTHEAMKSVQLSAHWDGLGDFCTLTPLPQAPQHKIMLSTSLSSGTDSSPSINFQQSNDTCCSKRDSVSTIELVQCGSSMPCQQSVRSSIVTGCAQPLKNFQCNPTTSSGNASSSGIGLDTPCKDFLFSDTNTSVFLEDDTLFDILKEPEPTWSPSLLPLKSNSPKQKRVSPPHFVGLRAISQKSPSVRSCRKFTLQAISSTVAATKSAI
ncbi:hypothetical protein L7F22_034981 [Adiantum nelumboides]|nr:hypothetical protein [Adiantum nelumboides]